MRRGLNHLFWIATILTFVPALVLMLRYAPVEVTMGPVQKVFYVHLPVAINTFLACFVVFVASIGYLWERRMWWDDLAAAGGKVAALLCAVVLLTGMIWGKSAWGQWWTWSPRLTFSLVLFLLFVVYLMIRPAIESPQHRAVVSEVYGIAAFLDVPIVYMSVRLMNDIHPTSIELEPAMKTTLLVWFVPVTLLTAGLVSARFSLNRRLRAIEERGLEDPHPTAAGQMGGAA